MQNFLNYKQWASWHQTKPSYTATQIHKILAINDIKSNNRIKTHEPAHPDESKVLQAKSNCHTNDLSHIYYSSEPRHIWSKIMIKITQSMTYCTSSIQEQCLDLAISCVKNLKIWIYVNNIQNKETTSIILYRSKEKKKKKVTWKHSR